MFEKLLSGNIETFRQRYEGTYGFYRDGQNKLLVRIASVDGGQCTFVDARNLTYHIAPDHPDNVGFEFLPPKSQWYNTARGAMYTQRMALRQWQRGVTGKTIEILLLQDAEMHPLRVDFANLSAIFEHPIRPADALGNLEKGLSLALSGQFAMSNGHIYVLKQKIGKVNFLRLSKKFVIKLDEPDLWRTEINDAITAMGCSASIS